MSFSFQTSKPQTGVSPGGNAGAGDTNKPVSAGFPLMSTPSQGKPGGLTFGTNQFGNASPSATGFNLGNVTTTSAPASNLTLKTLATGTATPGLTFGAANTPSSGFNLGGSAATPTTGLSFGIPKPGITGFSLGGRITPATTGATGLTFGTPTTTASTGYSIASLATTTATGFNLGSTPVSTVGTATGLALGGTTASNTPTGFSIAPSTTTPLAGTGFSVGGTTTTTPNTTFNKSTPAASTGFSLGGTPTTAATPGINLSGAIPSTTLATGFGVGKITSPAVSTAISTTTPQTSLGTVTTVSSSTSSGQVAGAINFCQLEESINKWTLELEEQEKAFVNQATQVNAWDKLLIVNGEKIVTLNQEVERVKLEQQQLEHELDYVVGQQKELQDCLVPLEKELASLSMSDPEREYTYRLAESLDTQLKQMSEDLKEIIEHLNEANRSQDSSDPIVQIGKILNAHMNSLQWLDQRTALLTQKIQQIDQMYQSFRQENERSFNLAYN